MGGGRQPRHVRSPFVPFLLLDWCWSRAALTAGERRERGVSIGG
jgi:hypothetical protein